MSQPHRLQIHSIVGKKTYYIGKPLRVLLLDFKKTTTISDTHMDFYT